MSINKGQVVGHVAAFIGGIILAGILGSFLGEKLGYAAGVLYAYGLFGHMKVSELIKKKVNKEK